MTEELQTGEAGAEQSQDGAVSRKRPKLGIVRGIKFFFFGGAVQTGKDCRRMIKPSPYAKPILLIIMVLCSLPLLLASFGNRLGLPQLSFFVLAEREKKDVPTKPLRLRPAAKDPQPMPAVVIDPLIGENPVVNVAKRLRESVRLLENASNWRELLPIVRSPDIVGAKMAEYFAGNPYEPIKPDLSNVSLRAQRIDGHPFALLEAVNANGQGLTLVFDLLTNPPRLDWEVMVAWNPLTIRELLENAGNKEANVTQDLRIVAGICTRELPAGVADSVLAFDLSHPGEPDLVVVGMAEDYAPGMDLLLQGLNQNLRTPVIARLVPTLKTTPDGTPICDIIEIVRLGWIHPDA